jgi:hypothetical protein
VALLLLVISVQREVSLQLSSCSPEIANHRDIDTNSASVFFELQQLHVDS